MPSGRGAGLRAANPKSTPQRNRGPRRPDKALYVPRAARERLPLPASADPGPGSGSGSSSSCSWSTVSGATTTEPGSSCSCSCCSDTLAVDTRPPSSVAAASRGLPNGDLAWACDAASGSSASVSPDESGDAAHGPRNDWHRPWSEAVDQTASCLVGLTLEDDGLAPVSRGTVGTGVEDDPQAGEMSPADGLHITETEDGAAFREEVMAHLKEAEGISIVHSLNDYSSFENVWLNVDEFAHVIEIYDFPSMFKTDDLLDAFAEYSDGGMKIKWVDNTHALGVFSSNSAALHALSIRHPLLKTRILSQGSQRAKGRALRRAEFIQPVKERPPTDSAVARRMVTRALGLQAAQGRGRARRY